MPRKRKKTIFRHGKRGVTSSDNVIHIRRWLAIEVLRKRRRMTLASAAAHLAANPDAVPEVPLGGENDRSFKTRLTFSSAAALRASHGIVEKQLANNKMRDPGGAIRLSDGTLAVDAPIHPHVLRKRLTGK